MISRMVVLDRGDFTTNTLGESHFEDLLRQLGIPEDEWENITEVSFKDLSESNIETI